MTGPSVPIQLDDSKAHNVGSSSCDDNTPPIPTPLSLQLILTSPQQILETVIKYRKEPRAREHSATSVRNTVWTCVRLFPVWARGLRGPLQTLADDIPGTET